MNLTQSQKSGIATCYIPGLLFVAAQLINMYLTKEDTSSQKIQIISFISTLIPYSLVWGWEWIMTRNYIKAFLITGIAIAARTALFFISLSIPSYDKQWIDLLFSILIFPIPVLLTGYMTDKKHTAWYYLIYPAFYCVTTGMIFIEFTFMHRSFVYEYLNWLMFRIYKAENDFYQFSLLYVVITFLTPYVYYILRFNLENTLNSTEKGNIWKQFLTNTEYISGRDFALSFAITYLGAIGLLCFIARTLAKTVGYFPEEHSSTDLYFYLPIAMILFLPLVLWCRSLVIRRLVTLQYKMGWTYLLSFVPVVNLIPYLYLTFRKYKSSKDSQYEYQSMMNDWQRNTNQTLIWIIIGMNILYSLYQLLLLFQAPSVYSQTDVVSVILLLIQSGLLFYFSISPKSFYWLGGFLVIYLFCMILLLFLSTGDERGIAISGITVSLLKLGVLVIYQQLFHPDINFETFPTSDMDMDAGPSVTGVGLQS